MFINKINGISGYLRPQVRKVKKEQKGIFSESAVVFEKDRQDNSNKREEENSKNESSDNSENNLDKNSDHINIFA